MPEPHPPAAAGDPVVTELRVEPPNSWLGLAGELDLHTAAQLREALTAATSAPVEELEVDLSGVGFASLSSLGELVEHARILDARGGRLVVRGARPLHRRVIALLEAPAGMVVGSDRPG